MAVDIGKRFGDHDVVQGLSFEVQRGTIFGIIGPSGGGKTTTIRMLLGVLRPTSGDLRVLGRAAAPVPPPRPRAPRLHAAAVRAVPGALGAWRTWGSRPRSTAWAASGAASASAAPWSWSSSGTRGIGRPASSAAACSVAWSWPRRWCTTRKCIFLDEPTAGIDPVLRAKFWEHFRALRDEGRTLIVTTQYVTESEYCDEILVLSDGQRVAMGTPEEVRRLAMGGEVVTVSGRT